MIAGLNAEALERWSENREAQERLPDLVRRLLAAADVRFLFMPAGNAVNQPGVDGRVIFQGTHPFIPDGESVWEMGCSRNPREKANDDYRKRIREFSEEERARLTYVQVTPRRWNDKERWIAEQREKGNWKEVRALDAHDLELWLQQNPAVALQVAEWLGIAGLGVCSPDSHYRSWARQCAPAITPEAFLTGQNGAILSLVKNLGTGSQFINVVADSAEEAAAFVSAVTAQCVSLASKAIVIASPQGWQLAQSNPGASILIAANAEIARAAPHLPECKIVIPVSSGHLPPEPHGPILRLERLPAHEFSEALQLAGYDRAEAERESRSCGRSWTVFRRLHAQNQAIAMPAWLDELRREGLQFLMLVSAWDGAREDDRTLIELLADRPYEEIECILDRLAHADDPPVTRVGGVWKARSPHELFNLLGSALHERDIDNFLQLAEDVLSEKDPRLDVPPEDRWFAQVLGKKRPFSGILYEALLNGLVMLAVLPDQMEDLPSWLRETRFHVHELVRKLLHDADAERWLSVADWLPWLAEAAPEAFLNAVEADLKKGDSPLVQLMTAIEGQEGFESISRTGFLWATELLAWSREHVARVARILAHLSSIPLNDNWVNRPGASLSSIFRPWYPQTSLDLEERKALLEQLARLYPDTVFDMLANQIMHLGRDTASPNYKPSWRDWAAGDPSRVTIGERAEASRHMCALAIRLAKGNAGYLARLFPAFRFLVRNFPRLARRLLYHAKDFVFSGTDEEREVLCASLRPLLHRFGYLFDNVFNARFWHQKLRILHGKLAPEDPVIRHAWLFSRHVELPLEPPKKWQEEETLVLEWRKKALQEILANEDWETELARLLDRAELPYEVGMALHRLSEDDDRLCAMVEYLMDRMPFQGRWMEFASGFLKILSEDELSGVLDLVADRTRRGLTAEHLASFLVACPFSPEVWRLAESHSKTASRAYWQKCSPWMRNLSKADLQHSVKQLMAVGRAAIALDAAEIRFVDLPPELLLSLLKEALVSGEGRLDHFTVVSALEVLENSSLAGSAQLAQLEFPLIEAFELDNLQQIPTLTHLVMNAPEEFVHLLCLFYRCSNTGKRNPDENLASLALSFLRSCTVQPGQKRDRTISEEDFRKFVEDSIALAADNGIEDDCRYWIGQILARGPAGEGGIIPNELARDVLERPENDRMREGFRTGRYNARGVVTKGPYEGGDQERELEGQYRGYARALSISHPNVAAMLNRLADTYRDEARRGDEEAALRREQG